MKCTVISRCMLLAVTLTFGGVAAQLSEPHGEALRDVRGHVAVTIAGSRMVMKDASNVVIWLEPLDPTAPTGAAYPPHKYVMEQHHKSFQPTTLVVPVGAAVDFPNLDPWFHNVFSLYRGKRFDLGLYEAGSRKQVVFDRPGASYIFCNIHPQMHAVVLAVGSEYFGISDKTGRVSISGVPSGTYKMHVWYEEAAAETLGALVRKLTFGNGDRAFPPISVVALKSDPMNHKNKYGEDYDSTEQNPKY